MNIRLEARGTDFVLKGNTAEALAFAIKWKFNRNGATGEWWIEKKNLHPRAEEEAHQNGWTGANLVVAWEPPKLQECSFAYTIDERLWDYQYEAILWLRTQRSCILNCDPGLGKTAITIKSMRPGDTALVVVPAAARMVWPREVEKWEKSIEINDTWKPGRPLVPFEVHIVSWDKLGDIKPEHLPKNTLVVADEFQLAKNWRSNRSTFLARIVESVLRHGGKFWALTGTPFTRYADDLWGILLAGCNAAKIFPGGFQEFKLLTGARRKKDGNLCYEPERISGEIGERLQSIMFRRTLEEVFPQMPDLLEDVVKLNVHPVNFTYFNELRDECLSPGGQAAWTIMRKELAKSKTAYALEYAKENGTFDNPLIVFSCFVEPIECFKTLDDWAVITGATSPEERGHIQDAFQAGKLKGVACTVGAAGVGLTFSRSNHTVFIDRDPSPTVMDQAIARMRRHLQTRTCFVTYIEVDHPIEGQLRELYTRKKAGHSALLRGVRAIAESFNDV